LAAGSLEERGFNLFLWEFNGGALIVANLADGALSYECRLLSLRPENIYGAYSHAASAERAEIRTNYFRNQITE
jgi:hypothetical protein